MVDFNSAKSNSSLTLTVSINHTKSDSNNFMVNANDCLSKSFINMINYNVSSKDPKENASFDNDSNSLNISSNFIRRRSSISIRDDNTSSQMKGSKNIFPYCLPQKKSKFFTSTDELVNLNKGENDKNHEYEGTILNDIEMAKLNIKCLESPKLSSNSEILKRKESNKKNDNPILSKFCKTEETKEEIPKEKKKNSRTYLIPMPKEEIENKQDFIAEIPINYNEPQHNVIYPSHHIEETNMSGLNIIQMCKEQIGCRELQKRISESTDFANSVVFPTIKRILVDVIIDPFGNYLMQKLLEKLSSEHLVEITFMIIDKLYYLSSNSFGTRVVQKYIEYMPSKLKINFLMACKSNFTYLALNINACHVISKLFSVSNSEDLSLFQDNVISNVKALITNKHGCCVCQKFIERCSPDSRYLIVYNIMNNVESYISDPYANYVLQMVIPYGFKELNSNIVNSVKTNFLHFALEKFSSNVIEKCLGYCTDSARDEIINMVKSNSNIVKKLLLDLYGNHILQKVIFLINDITEKEKLLDIVMENWALMDSTPHGSKLKARLTTTYSYISSKLLNTNTNMNNDIYKNKKVKTGDVNPNLVQNKNQSQNQLLNQNMYLPNYYQLPGGVQYYPSYYQPVPSLQNPQTTGNLQNQFSNQNIPYQNFQSQPQYYNQMYYYPQYVQTNTKPKPQKSKQKKGK